MTLLYLCLADTDTIIPLRLHLLYHPLFNPGYCSTYIRYLVPCSGYVSPLFTNMVRPLPYDVYKPMYLVESNPKFDLVCYRVV